MVKYISVINPLPSAIASAEVRNILAGTYSDIRQTLPWRDFLFHLTWIRGLDTLCSLRLIIELQHCVTSICDIREELLQPILDDDITMTSHFALFLQLR